MESFESIKKQLVVETWPIDRLVPYARNPRKNDEQVDRMCSAIREFGFRIPIVAKSDGTVVDGHLRLKAAQKLGLQEVPVALADELTDTQVKAFRLLANQSANWADWDPELLKLEIDDLKLVDYDIDLIGFDEEDLKLLEDEGQKNATDEQQDSIPELQEDAVSVTGDIWILGRHRLMCGNCTDRKNVSRLLDGVKIDACITDPPYGLGNTVSTKNNYNEYNDTIENLRELIAGIMPIMRDVAPVVVLTTGVLNMWEWPRPTWVMSWAYAAGAARCPYGFSCWQPILCYGKDPKLSKGKGSHPDSLIKQEATKVDWHPCSKPVGPWTWLFERITEEGENVFDPFNGSGTGIIVAEQTKRSCYAVELNALYVDQTIRRWQELTGKQAVHAISGKTFDEVCYAKGQAS